ncbi:Uncharacterised protein [Mycobacteroides abscessus subsp. abscessus]|nr:Uncharacterised protein [Mycobacteroides abscessus subsp. abscessus]
MHTPLDQSVRNLLLARRGEWADIANSSQVSHSWMSKFVNGHIPNPGYATLSRLAASLGLLGDDVASVEQLATDGQPQEAGHA